MYIWKFAKRKRCLFFDKNYRITIKQLVSIYNAIDVFKLIISSVCSWTCVKAILRKKENHELFANEKESTKSPPSLSMIVVLARKQEDICGKKITRNDQY